MSYLGEKGIFSFREGKCEEISRSAAGSTEMAAFGRTIAPFFSRFSVGSCGFQRLHLLYALCSGISECGKDVFICENTDLPSFRFGSPLISADCGIFIGSGTGLELSFFDRSGAVLPVSVLEKIMNSEPAPAAGKSGKITSATSFRNIYVNNISDSLNGVGFPISAGISCGNRSVRSLWLEFFTGEDDELVFQISDDGQRVNAYSRELGFVSYERLILAYALKLADSGEKIWLPESFHYGAELACDNGIIRFSDDSGIPENAENSRFLRDSLYMCCHLANDRIRFISAVRRIPSISSVKREIAADNAEKAPLRRMIDDDKGRVIITRSGKNRLTLLAQAMSSETAAELCNIWTDKLKNNSDTL